MLFGPTKSVRADKFNLQGLNAATASRRPAGLAVWQKLGLSALAGLLLAFSSPGFGQWWLAWFMVAPFLVLLTKCRSSGQSILCGLFFGLGYHLLALRFYADAHLHISEQIQLPLLIWLVQAALLSLPTAAFAWLVNALPLRPGYIPYFQRPFFPYLISVPLLWIFLHHGLAVAHPLTAFWQLAPLPPVAIDALPYSQYSQLAIIQLAKFIGSLGIEFLLLLVNAAVACFWLELIQVQDRPVERVDAISPRLGAVVDLSIAVGLVGLIYFFGVSQIMSAAFAFNDAPVNAPVAKNYFSNESNQPKIPVGVLRGDIFGVRAESSISTLKDRAASFEIIALPEPSQIVNLTQSDNVLDLIKKTVHQNRNAAVFSFISQKVGIHLDRNLLVCRQIVFIPNEHCFTQMIICHSAYYLRL